MAVYKVPQDVEADDKLIGPFSFRQFVYIIIVVIAIALAWGLSQLFIPLAIIPVPIIVFFGALALPLRKDQPMETYLAAIVSFHLKPRKRLWQPDGIQSLVEITAPKVIEVQRTKDLSQTEAQQRLSYLADIVDTEGWAVRGVEVPSTNSPMQSDAYFAAQQIEDVLDSSGGVARSFDTMIGQADAKRHEEMLERMKQAPPAVQPTTSTPPPTPDPYAALASPPTTAPTADPHLTFDPYPTAIHQSVVNPLGTQPATSQTTSTQPPAPPMQPVKPTESSTPPTTTSEKPVSPGIISLANNPDLSIETIAHEAQRIHEQEDNLPDEEVVISLR
jgi:hypothetical protein